ncbi:hypothetical protein E4P39_09995 [Blastococcus sp. CT_GayMR19]|uniref:hypothetical protein n=1 Tax=Blastococcus sp. CT_GayMR19 TaxID=2559608 RepID=UPI00107322C6|nr:hypothetical protein [Blastococcus sp. CT_GayMR19]TFV75390.1 hypothetical protein E4P39_09995 [Blastococcus sp. CT_GayMR19]
MILAAGLLVLLGLGLFVAGILTGATALYWGCVAACVVAAVLLVVARRRISAAASGGTPAAANGAPAATPGQGTAAPAGATEPAGAAAPAGPAAPPEDLPDPDVEEVEVTDLLLVVDLKDEVLVLDEHPRYHLADCVHLRGRTPIPLPVDEARTDGFTPCAVCEPDRNLAQRARARRHATGT